MQVVIRMNDAEMLSEVVDSVETDFGFTPSMETAEGEMCVASYTVDDVATTDVVVGALLHAIEAHGLAVEQAENAYQWNVQIS